MKNILIVDDDHMIRDLLYSFLRIRFRNYHVLTAGDGERAIAILKNIPVSLIITDLRMPNVDGFGVIAYAKKNHPSVPIFVMSGAARSMELEGLMRTSGVIHFIWKPFDFEEVEQLVSEALADSVDASPPLTIA
jgi:DNA-binding NtrC family response regulator